MLMALFINERGSVFGGNLLPQKYSPTQRIHKVHGLRFAGARHGHIFPIIELFMESLQKKC